ncbi:OmpA family protein [Thiotrichales bacterium HSG1]|nr:OmpA family protein [Thiotrichales bacterium HSG1]
MKQQKASLMMFGALLLIGQTVVNAQEYQQNGVYVSPSVGYYFFDEDGDNNAEDSLLYGLSIGYQINKNFALELNYSGIDSEVDDLATDLDGKLRNPGDDVTTDLIRLDGIYNLDLSSPWSPYLAVGYTRLNQDPAFNSSEEEDMMDLGLGIKRSITPSLSLKADVRAYHNFDNEDTDYGLQLGVAYLFGATPPPPPEPEPVKVVDPVDPCSLDDDQDGVNNCDDMCSGTPIGSKIETTGCRLLDVPEKIHLKILFDFDKAIVKQEYFPEIKRVVDFMQKYPSTKTEIQGHTDSTGNDAYNLDLSQRRTDAVFEVLVNEFGVDSSRLNPVGYGESQPIADNGTREGRQMNRRVIAHIETVVQTIEKQ